MLGDHIGKRGLDLGMHQKDVAALVSGTTSTFTNWEKNRCSPALRFRPKIILFLGYEPISRTPSGLGERIRTYKYKQGVSIKKLAEILGVDPTRPPNLERGETMPGIRLIKALSAVLGDIT